eukprot:UN09337
MNPNKGAKNITESSTTEILRLALSKSRRYNFWKSSLPTSSNDAVDIYATHMSKFSKINDADINGLYITALSTELETSVEVVSSTISGTESYLLFSFLFFFAGHHVQKHSTHNST